MYSSSWLWVLLSFACVSTQKTDVLVCPERCTCPKKRDGDKFTKVECGGLDKPIMSLNEIPFTQLSNFTNVTFL